MIKREMIVKYYGNKFAAELGGRMGKVVGYVEGDDRKVIVDFGLREAFALLKDNLSPVKFKVGEAEPEIRYRGKDE